MRFAGNTRTSRLRGRRSNLDRNIEREALSDIRAHTIAGSVNREVCDSFFELLAHTDRRLLLLDYDGTLAPFCTDRACAFPYAAIPGLLRSIAARSDTRVVIVSGRRALEIVPLLGLDPHLEIWGSHGIERLTTDGELRFREIDEMSLRALAEVDAALEEHGLTSILEFKPGATALHWRGFSRSLVSDIRARVERVSESLGTRSQLNLIEFDGGLEFRVPSCNKGHAVREVIAEAGPEAVVAYLGDDQTDEDAFCALNGIGLTGLVRPSYRATNAKIWLRPPDEVQQFLARWLLACGGEA